MTDRPSISTLTLEHRIPQDWTADPWAEVRPLIDGVDVLGEVHPEGMAPSCRGWRGPGELAARGHGGAAQGADQRADLHRRLLRRPVRHHAPGGRPGDLGRLGEHQRHQRRAHGGPLRRGPVRGRAGAGRGGPRLGGAGGHRGPAAGADPGGQRRVRAVELRPHGRPAPARGAGRARGAGPPRGRRRRVQRIPGPRDAGLFLPVRAAARPRPVPAGAGPAARRPHPGGRSAQERRAWRPARSERSLPGACRFPDGRGRLAP